MATAARGVETVAAAARRVEAARLSATAARGVEAAAAAPLSLPFLPLRSGRRGAWRERPAAAQTDVRRRRRTTAGQRPWF
ncbi:hypothetical protein OsI_08274 [Oryza sativa Indica Group]|uniref:Uncharacterized protein n=1 Tax=Oryza sativa subsp. indica TaxID=39946 RepID=A2X7T0_ORYSI|nr:hypothetical protein OsI_08274 [Oryza sativa Indica Group]